MSSIYKLRTEIRILLAIILGIFVVIFTRYAANETKSDMIFAEMVHSLADILGLLFYLVALLTVGKVGEIIGRLSGFVLLLAGVVSFGKLFTTFERSVIHDDFLIKNPKVLLLASVFALVCIFLQLVLIKKEHNKLHGHMHDHTKGKHVHHAHHAANTELYADILQASFVMLGALFMFVVPDASVFIRALDIFITFWIGAWMIERGWKIIRHK